MDAHVHMYASIQLDFSPVKYCHFLAHRFFHLKSIILAMPTLLKRNKLSSCPISRYKSRSSCYCKYLKPALVDNKGHSRLVGPLYTLLS